MLPDNVREFCANNHQGVLTCFRRNGASQMSIVTVGSYADGVAFTVTETRAKLHNLRRNPNCTLLVSAAEWRPFVVLEGQARILSANNTDADELRTDAAGRVPGGRRRGALQLGGVRRRHARRPTLRHHRCANAHLRLGPGLTTNNKVRTEKGLPNTPALKSLGRNSANGT